MMAAGVNGINRHLRRAGYGFKKLSEITKLPYAAAYGAVKGKTNPQLDTLEKICKVLELELRPVKKVKKDE